MHDGVFKLTVVALAFGFFAALIHGVTLVRMMRACALPGDEVLRVFNPLRISVEIEIGTSVKFRLAVFDYVGFRVRLLFSPPGCNLAVATACCRHRKYVGLRFRVAIFSPWLHTV